MGCFHNCMQCLRLVPWSSLIGVIFCWAGTALFCGAGHEALTNTPVLLNSSDIPGFKLDQFVAADLFQSLKYAIYAIAAYMLVLSILLFVDGVLATRNVKRDFSDGCKSTTCGICIGVYYTALSYLTSCGWLLIASAAALPLSFFISTLNQCSLYKGFCTSSSCVSNVCVDFVHTGLMRPAVNNTITLNANVYGRLCDQDLAEFCLDPQFRVVFELVIVAFAGAALTLISMIHFLMCLSANFAYIKMSRKLVEYEDAKYREEMELNDIINTARSNERLTH